jgi:hypothetical protein
MKNQPKLQLSKLEMELVTNTEWILTKNGILEKVKNMLAQLQGEQQEFLQSNSKAFPAGVLQIPAKISKGENYQGLPYLVLDYPRYFEKNDHFAIRTMFWWGNFFSTTLYLSGSHKKKYEDKIGSCFTLLQQEDFFIGVNADQWEHHFESSNYLSLKEMNDAGFKDYVRKKEFIKLAKRFSLEQWDTAGDTLFICFRQLILWLNN